jgi:thiol-disulfide isomerase/thioredoxin
MILSLDEKNNSSSTVSSFNKTIKKGNCLVLFYASWCPHCVNMRPEWNKFLQKIKNNNNNNVNVLEAESAVIPKKYLNQVEGYPTIKYYSSPNKTPIHYTGGPITSDNLLDFINQYANKSRETSAVVSPHKHRSVRRGRLIRLSGGSKTNKHNSNKNKRTGKKNNTSKRKTSTSGSKKNKSKTWSFFSLFKK